MGHLRKQMISFLLSACCDLDCSYCYVPKLGKIEPEHEVIDIEFAIVGMEDFFQQNKSRAIRFFGAGEPTNAFNEMKEIRNKAYEIVGNDLKVELQTNGYFSDEVADWVEENVDILWISCDGPPEIQDVQRPVKGGRHSSGVVLRNINRFSQCSHIQLGVRATISEGNFSRQTELIDYFHELGICCVCAAPTYSSTANPSVKPPSLLEFARHFISAFYKAKELGMFYQTHLIVNFDEKVDIYGRACTPCPHLTTDGCVSCCDWALFGPKYLPGPLQQLVYGKWDKKDKRIIYDKEKISRIQARNVKTLNTGACSNCKIIHHCAGGCLGKTIVITGDLYKPTKDWCEATCYLAERIPLNKGLFPCLHS
jgi:radical SAM protein with 4Fe4S-binding SPASM domain